MQPASNKGGNRGSDTWSKFDKELPQKNCLRIGGFLKNRQRRDIKSGDCYRRLEFPDGLPANVAGKWRIVRAGN